MKKGTHLQDTLALLLWLALSLGGYTLPAAEPPDRPNIIFILTDDQRWDAAGFAGNTIIRTPEMDRLARRGVNFVNAFVTTPICAASRASFLTGLHERTHRYTFQVASVRGEYMNTSYPKLLRASGYHLGFFGKLGVNIEDPGELFDVYEVYDRNNKYKDRRGYYYKSLGGDTVHLTTYTGEQARQFLHSVPEGKPFCLSISFSAPHAHDGAPDQYFWEPELDALYSDVDIPEPAISDDRYFMALPQIVRDGINRVRWGWRFDTPEKYQKSVKGYFRMISGVDRELGKIRRELRKLKLHKKTIIILMGDNGYFLGERQLAGKWLMYDNSIRVPLVVYDPRERGKKVHEEALNIDVPATMLGYAGVEAPAHWQGRSLLPLIRGDADELGRDTLLFEHLWETRMIPPSEGVRTAGWKYFRYINDKSIEELYNLVADPQEVNNLVADGRYADVLGDLRQKCDEMIARYRDPLSGIPDSLSVVTGGPARATATPPVHYRWRLPETAKAQRGFQILVASSVENIERNIGDVWDSGQVREGAAGHGVHGGVPLVSGRRYFWKVRIWDADNRLTDYAGPVSFTAP